MDGSVVEGVKLRHPPYNRTWSEASDELLKRTKRSIASRSVPDQFDLKWIDEDSSLGQMSISSSITEETEQESVESNGSDKSVAGRSKLSRFFGSLRSGTRRVFNVDNLKSLRRRSMYDGEDDRLFGFETLDGEIQRILWSSTIRSSQYAPEMNLMQPVESLDVVIADIRGCSRTVNVNWSTTAADACRAFNPTIDLRYWQLYEELSDMPGFVHPIEDHESIMSIIRKWSPLEANAPQPIDTRFYLWENTKKYSPMSEGRQFTDTTSNSIYDPEDIQIDKSTLLNPKGKPPLPNQTQVSFPTCITSGQIWVRSPQHRSWQKLFCFLHGSSVFYSAKKRSVSARHMRIVVDLPTVDIFHPKTAYFKLPFKAPTNEVFVCRPIGSHVFDPKLLTVFACRTPEGRVAWENGFRVHKFGMTRLELNLKRIVDPQYNQPETSRSNGHRRSILGYGQPELCENSIQEDDENEMHSSC